MKTGATLLALILLGVLLYTGASMYTKRQIEAKANLEAQAQPLNPDKCWNIQGQVIYSDFFQSAWGQILYAANFVVMAHEKALFFNIASSDFQKIADVFAEIKRAEKADMVVDVHYWIDTKYGRLRVTQVSILCPKTKQVVKTFNF